MFFEVTVSSYLVLANLPGRGTERTRRPAAPPGFTLHACALALNRQAVSEVMSSAGRSVPRFIVGGKPHQTPATVYEGAIGA